MRAHLIPSTVLWLLLAVCPAGAEMYHWVDQNGISHFANTPPPAGVKAKNSWAEIRYDPAAAKAAAAENARVIEASEAKDAEEKAAEIAAKAERDQARDEKIAALEAKRKALADQLLSSQYNFRSQARPLRWKIEALDRQIASGGDAPEVKKLKTERAAAWDELFTPRYVIREGYALMEQYQQVIETLNGLEH